VEVIPILLDTNAYAAFKRGLPDAVAIFQQAPTIALSPVIVGELLGGFAAGAKEQANRAELTAFLSAPRVWVVPVDRETAEHYAGVYAALRKTGTPIPTNDMWIAATALQHKLRLFTYDNHFRSVPGLVIGSTVGEFVSP
jgi:predicted nucleic acid-binding protein